MISPGYLVKAEPRSFTDDEVRKIMANASEPFSTIVMVTAVLGLRIGETLALRTYDVDFESTSSACAKVLTLPLARSAV